MPEPAPGQSNRQGSGQGSGRPPPQPPPTMPGPATTAWEPPAPRAPRYATAAPGTTYYPPDPPVRQPPPSGRTATRPPVTPPAQRPRPPAGPVRTDGPKQDGATSEAPTVAPVARGKRKQAVVRGVRSRRLIRRFDIWSVFKVSVIFYICVFVVMLVAGTVLWNVAAAFGIVTDGEKLVRSLFRPDHLHPAPAYCVLVGVGDCRRRLLHRRPVQRPRRRPIQPDQRRCRRYPGGRGQRSELRRQRVSSFGWRRLSPGAIAQPVRAQH